MFTCIYLSLTFIKKYFVKTQMDSSNETRLIDKESHARVFSSAIDEETPFQEVAEYSQEPNSFHVVEDRLYKCIFKDFGNRTLKVVSVEVCRINSCWKNKQMYFLMIIIVKTMKLKSITTCMYLGSTPGSTTILRNGNSTNCNSPTI